MIYFGARSILIGAMLVTAAFAAQEQQKEKVYKVGGQVQAPSVADPVIAEYSDKAIAAKVEGAVVLKVVVGSDGCARNIQITRTLHRDLDKNAIEAIKQWKFQPATRKGKPVAVEATVEVGFHLP